VSRYDQCQWLISVSKTGNKLKCIYIWGPPSLLSNGYEGFFPEGVKQLGREADHSPPSSAEVEECVELYLHSPNTPSWHGT